MVSNPGFVLGTGRILFLVPLLGERTAELLEMPLMLGVMVAAARWLVRHRLDDGRLSSALSVGFIAMGLVLIADLTVGMLLRGMSAAEVFLHRDPVTGAAYYASLVLFAAMPALLAQRLNVRHRVRFASLLAAALLDGLFAYPAWLFSVVPILDICDGYRSQNEFFRSLLGDHGRCASKQRVMWGG